MFKPDQTVNEAMVVLKNIERQLEIRNILEMARIRNAAYTDGVYSEDGFEMDDSEYRKLIADIWDVVL